MLGVNLTLKRKLEIAPTVVVGRNRGLLRDLTTASFTGVEYQFYLGTVTDSDHFFFKWSFGAASGRLDFENS